MGRKEISFIAMDMQIANFKDRVLLLTLFLSLLLLLYSSCSRTLISPPDKQNEGDTFCFFIIGKLRLYESLLLFGLN